MADADERALAGLRVLDLSGAMGNYCGKLFAELGADVILIEPPEGGDLRGQPPYVDDLPGLENSLKFFYNNTSKRGVCLDLEAEAGRDVLRTLAAKADLLIEDKPPGELARLGLGAEDLLGVNPRLVVTSVTPFGQVGPYAQYEHSDLVCLALGGLLWMGGYADGPPVMAAGEQAYVAGNLFAAVSSMVALTHAELHGEGQWNDVSVQESVAMGLENAAQFYDLEGHIRRRFGGTQRQAGFGVYPSEDGDVFLLAGGIGGNRFWPNLVDWMDEDGVPDTDRFRGDEWGDTEFLTREDTMQLFWEVFTAFTADKTRQALYHESQRWRVPLCPLNRPSDVLESAQLQHRGFFVEVEAFDRTFKVPGAPYRLSETPWRLDGPAPSLGEHTEEVLAEHGFGQSERDTLREQGVIK